MKSPRRPLARGAVASPAHRRQRPRDRAVDTAGVPWRGTTCAGPRGPWLGFDFSISLISLKSQKSVQDSKIHNKFYKIYKNTK
jgi:hypothetical protein